MAGEWIKVRVDLFEDPAVIQMADKLGVREEVVVGYCVKFWSWVSRQCNAPSVTGVTLSALGRVLQLPGFPELLVEVGWLEYDEKGKKPVLTIPNFDRHLSQSAKGRALTASRVARSRNGQCNAVSVTSALPEKRREEKRREENKNPLPPLPESLSELQNDWNDWIKHRDELGKPLTPTQAAKLIGKLSALGLSRASRAIQHTIANGWVGIREPDATNDTPTGDAF